MGERLEQKARVIGFNARSFEGMDFQETAKGSVKNFDVQPFIPIAVSRGEKVFDLLGAHFWMQGSVGWCTLTSLSVRQSQ